ncbi:MAG: hypothetical protein EOM03_14575 [Clostridia bacterium]|nr:hypothetical protein [Clostridia bacterium]
MSYQVLQRVTGRRETRRIDLPIVPWDSEWPLCYFTNDSIYSLPDGWDGDPVIIKQGHPVGEGERFVWVRSGPDGNIYTFGDFYDGEWKSHIRRFSSSWEQMGLSWPLADIYSPIPQDVSSEYLYALRAASNIPATVYVHTLNGALVRTFQVENSDKTDYTGALRVDPQTDTLYIKHTANVYPYAAISKVTNTGITLKSVELGRVTIYSLTLGKDGDVFAVLHNQVSEPPTVLSHVFRLDSNLDLITAWPPFPEVLPHGYYVAFYVTASSDGSVFVSGEYSYYEPDYTYKSFFKVRKFSPDGELLGERDYEVPLLDHALCPEFYPRIF